MNQPREALLKDIMSVTYEVIYSDPIATAKAYQDLMNKYLDLYIKGEIDREALAYVKAYADRLLFDAIEE